MQNSPEIVFDAIDQSNRQEEELQSILLFSEQHITAIRYARETQRFFAIRNLKAEHPGNLILQKEELQRLLPDFPLEEVKVVLPGLKVSLVPEALYDERAKAELFRHNHPIQEDEQVFADYLKHIRAYMLYALPEDMERGIRYYYGRNSYCHHTSPWLEVLQLQMRNSSGLSVHVDIVEEGILLAVFRDGGLYFFNTFACDVPEDRLYYIMFVSEQLRLNPHRDNYILSGLIRKGDELHRLFQRYIKELSFAQRPSIYQYSLPVKSLPEHIFFKAFCTPVCAS